MMKNILITGSEGTIGRIIRNNLTDYAITLFDLPKHDARNYPDLLEALYKHDVLIHLAWNTKIDNYKSSKIDPDNCLMTYNAYECAKLTKVKRIIMASSVHANDFSRHRTPPLYVSIQRTNTG